MCPQGKNWTLKKRAALVGLFVKVSVGAVAVMRSLIGVNGNRRFVVALTR